MTDEAASNEPEFISVPDLARRLNVTKPFVYGLVKRGLVKAIYLGNETIRVPVAEVERIIREGCPTPGPRRGVRKKRQVDPPKE